MQRRVVTRFMATTKTHYEGLTDSYENGFFYQSATPYTEHLCGVVRKALRPHGTLLDIGGGTGNFTKALVDSTDCKAVVIDPFLEGSSTTESDAAVSYVKAKAEDFALPDPTQRPWTLPFHQVLLKEVAHHLHDRPLFFQGLYDGLQPSPDDRPSVLIITRPQKEIDYPIWDAAKDVWAENQPSLEQFSSELSCAGFGEISHTIERYDCSIPLDKWQKMVKNRFWSTFAGFSDEELEAACLAMTETEKHRLHDGDIHFEDRLLFITATRK